MIFLTDVRRSTAEYFKITEDALTARGNFSKVAAARHVGMYLCREMTGKPLSKISKTFNRENHTTALHGIRKVARAIESGNETVAVVVTAIRESVLKREAARLQMNPPVIPQMENRLEV